MRFALSVVLVAAPALAFADDGGKTELPKPDTKAVPILGGSAAGNKWPDAVAVEYGGVQECTGTLVAPTVVVTAGHCVIGGAPNSVLVGASALSRASEGERIAVAKSIEYPSSQSSIDIGVLVLKVPSAKVEPRAIASGWAKWDIVNNAAVEFVGFGTTDRNGMVETDELLEVQSTITDYNCTTSDGCNTPAKPDGELGAGGGGIDTCPGDSGGPMYLLTDYGNFLAGVTSRSYDNATYACGEGGIYGRPDKIVDWIEEQTLVKVTRGPTPTIADALDVVVGNPIEAKIAPNDPKSNDHTFTIKTQPGYGKAAVNEDGTLRVCGSKEFFGKDKVTVTVTDANNPTRTVDATFPINILEGDPPDDCDETAFGDDGGGCCSASRDARGSILLAAFVLLTLRRRRR
ncbi:MAG TPA: trypsin-like serine protease [Kofleriaceae bacterium]|nr:trypsin-like serine protease [Kofleriaceae bacterium]